MARKTKTKVVIFTTHMEDGWIAEVIENAEKDNETVHYESGFCDTEDEAIDYAVTWAEKKGYRI